MLATAEAVPLPLPLPPRSAPASFSRPPSSSRWSDGAARTAEWAQLLQRYQDGTCAVDMSKVPVEKPPDLAWDEPAESDGARPPPLAPPTDGGDVDFAREFYRKEGYLPALRNPREEERRRVLQRYSLSKVGQVPAIDELAALARDVFDVDVVVVNVVLEDRVLFVSTSGWDEHECDADAPRQSVALTTSFCPHAMSKPPSAGCFQIPDTVEDWRFRRSPLVQEGKGPIGFFASSNIYLPASQSTPSSCAGDDTADDTLPIGSLCLIHPTPRAPLTERQERMLKQMAKTAAKQFELSFEKERRRANDIQQEYLYALLNSLIVWPSRNLTSSATDLPCNLIGTATEVQRQTGSDFALILDLRGFNNSDPDPTPPPSLRRQSGPPSANSRKNTPVHSPSSLPSSLHTRDDFFRLRRGSLTSRRDANVHGPGTVSIMDVECGGSDETTRELKEAWESVINSSGGVDSIAKALAEWHDTGQTMFTIPVATPDNPSPALRTPLLGVLTPDVTAAIAVPVFDHEGEPMLYVVAGSRQRHFEYEETDQRFVKSVGALLVAGMLQERILAADKAKQAFLSQVSHELRTPMFAIGSQLELIRIISEPSTLESISPLLDVAEVCLTSLREVLDDTLDVSKLNNGGESSASLVTVELEALVIEVVKSCWHKAKRLAALRAEDEEGVSGSSSAVEQVDVLLRTSLPPGTKAMVDVGALKRVLINLFANAIKFTPRGTITFTMAPDGPCMNGVLRIKFEVEDTGKGMSPDFLRDHLFVAFRQEDSFTNGAGLGVSIAESIVKRMGGTLRYRSAPNQGTTATVTLPLEGVTATSAISDPAIPVTRNLSEELASLFDPQGTLPPSRTSPATSPATSMVECMPSVADAAQRVAEDEDRTRTFTQGAKKTLISASPVDIPAATVAVAGKADAAAERVRVLVVDDNPIARRILCTFLKTKKISHVDASGGVQAIERFKEFRPNLVWCDIQMPGVDGIQATREMREYEDLERLPAARIVAISGLDSTLGEHASVLSSGQVDRWLVKSGSSLRALADDLAEYTKMLVQNDGGAVTSIDFSRALDGRAQGDIHGQDGA
ncbi:hypothetical protein JCM3770_004810 [Rhodotorula araucariae]